MAKPILIDVDVALKLCMYRLDTDFLTCTTLDQPPAMLTIGQFVLRHRLRVKKNLQDHEGIMKSLENLLARVSLVVPTSEEFQMAASFEESALKSGLNLDTGESQLLAVLLKRGAPLLLTGDKRAIRALYEMNVQGIDGRIACLEQLIASIIGRCGHQRTRDHVCQEASIDKTLAICFSCLSPTVICKQEIMSGLASYVANLRKATGSLLLSSLDLSSIVP